MDGPEVDIVPGAASGFPAASLQREIENNEAGLANVLDALRRLHASLQRIVLMEGTQWHGSHPGRIARRHGRPRCASMGSSPTQWHPS